MKSDNVQVLALAGIILAAMIIALISWSLIPDSPPAGRGNASSSDGMANYTNGTRAAMDNTSLPGETIPDSNGSAIDSKSSVPEGSPSSIVKWTDGKLGSELTSDGTAQWNQLITSMVNAKIAYNRLSWDNVFYDSLYGGGNAKLQVTLAFTDGGGWDCQRNPDGIGYHGTWAPTTTTWVVTSGTWNPRWTLGVSHSYSPDFTQQGADTGITGLHYITYE
jgi:hypothetical protein